MYDVSVTLSRRGEKAYRTERKLRRKRLHSIRFREIVVRTESVTLCRDVNLRAKESIRERTLRRRSNIVLLVGPSGMRPDLVHERSEVRRSATLDIKVDSGNATFNALSS